MKKMLLSLTVLVIIFSVTSVGTKFLGTLSREQEEKMQEITGLTKKELELMRQDFAELDVNEDALHASAPEEKTWIESIVDEIARWFGLI